MADFIIKPASGDTLKLQDEGGDDAISISATGVSTLTNATITAGTITAAKFPSGHQIKQSVVNEENQASHITIASTTFVSTGIEVTHVTQASSADSYLEYAFYSGMAYRESAAQNTQYDITMRTVSNDTYTAGESLTTNTWMFGYANITGATNLYRMDYLRTYCGLETGMGMPATKSSWNAGDTLYFRLFAKRGSGNFYVSYANSTWNASVKEIAR